MALAQCSLLTTVVLLVAAEMVMSNPDPPPGSCRDHICLNDYRGDGTDVNLCEQKSRLVQYCPPKKELCLAAPCEERKECSEQGGFCVSDQHHCEGRVVPGLCEGHGCFCCFGADNGWPTEEYIEPSVSVCSGSVALMPDDTVGIFSPNFPHPYGKDIDCTLNVGSSVPILFKIEFLYFDLEGCQYDSLSINPAGYILSGSSLPDTVHILGNISLTFRTDSTVLASGFYLKLTAIRAYDICTESSITTSYIHGALLSPNHPNEYSNDLDCSTVITGPTGTRLSFNWLFFDLESHSTCYYDSLQIYDQNSPSTDLYCGHDGPPTFTMSTTNQVQVDFRTDFSIVYEGFLVVFTVV